MGMALRAHLTELQWRMDILNMIFSDGISSTK
jgi:hypothetical protein